MTSLMSAFNLIEKIENNNLNQRHQTNGRLWILKGIHKDNPAHTSYQDYKGESAPSQDRHNHLLELQLQQHRIASVGCFLLSFSDVQPSETEELGARRSNFLITVIWVWELGISFVELSPAWPSAQPLLRAVTPFYGIIGVNLSPQK